MNEHGMSSVCALCRGPTQDPDALSAEILDLLLKGNQQAAQGDDKGAGKSYAQILKQTLRSLQIDPHNFHAQFCIGTLYDGGRGVAKDYAQAAKWFRKAADQGHAKAQYHLAVMYKFGDGVAQDNTTAVMWLRKTAEQGNAEAQEILSDMLTSCDMCQKPGATRICSKCKCTVYCNRACQRAHLKVHKRGCLS
jgi:TPR repeat protein